jgi:predicted molibdopterin-dependent oxidoreductase YjgC
VLCSINFIAHPVSSRNRKTYLKERLKMEPANWIVMDGHEFTFTPGETLLEVARRNGIDIPTLCHMKGATPTGACRVCLVEVEGARTLLASCATPAAPKMVVKTESPRVVRSRQLNIELLLASGHHNCLAPEMDADVGDKSQEDRCPADGECRLQGLALRYQVRTSRFEPSGFRHPVENVNPLIARDLSRCVLCGRCVQACNEIQVNNAISYGYRGAFSKIVAKGDRALKDSDCVFCGECVQACPVGALIALKDLESTHPSKENVDLVRTTCSYCGVGCQIHLHVKEGRVRRVTGVEDVGPNYGSLCVKGRFGYDFIHDPARLKTPLIRENGEFREASWDEALNLVAKRLGAVRKTSGPDAVGLFSSARITNEENYLTQKFARAVLGTNNVDHCARL